MTPTGEEEFIFSVVVLGGVIFAGSLVVIGLTIVGIAIFKKKKKEFKLTIHGKERQNGQSQKGGSRGNW